MSVEELKTALLGKEFSSPIQIGPDQVVVDVETFLRVSFLEVDKWQKDIVKCPAYVRLMKFNDAIQA